jgi:hypothetical protein
MLRTGYLALRYDGRNRGRLMDLLRIVLMQRNGLNGFSGIFQRWVSGSFPSRPEVALREGVAWVGVE